MKRDMELMRKILFAIEEEAKPERPFVWNLKIEGYDTQTIGAHCDLLEQEGLVKYYKPVFADNNLHGFHVGDITSRGHDYLELIRNNEVWDKAKTEIETKKLPNTVETITKVAALFMADFFKNLNS